MRPPRGSTPVAAPPSRYSNHPAGEVEERDEQDHSTAGLGPRQLALRRLRRNRVALCFLALFFAIVALCLAAPLYAEHVAGVGPDDNNLTGKVERGGEEQDIVTPDGTPIGPGLSNEYLLGADANGRDVAVRLLYGGRNSLFVGFMSALITTLIATALGLMAGYFRGKADLGVRTLFDILWSFPVLLFAIALGTALAVGGLDLGPIHIAGNSIWIPTLVIGFVLIPYLGRPIRGQVLSLR
ncbi:MAG: ABC transporter permease, partial [Solirubrobacterales bacterium]